MTAPLRDVLDARIDEARIQKLWRGLAARSARPPRARAVAIGAVAIGIAALAALVASRPAPTPLVLDDGAAPGLVESGAGQRTLSFADGSLVTLDPGTVLVPTRNDGARFELRLREGAATFSVTPGGPRRWVVDCGEATVDVIGTVFRIEHRPSGLSVAVTRGHVRVASAEGVRELSAGEDWLITPSHEAAETGETRGPTPHEPEPAEIRETLEHEPETTVAPREEGSAAAEPEAREERTAPSATRVEPPASTSTPEPALEPPAVPEPTAEPEPTAPSWPDLAASGAYDDAWVALGPGGVAGAWGGADAERLLLLADVARLSGHPREAVAPLERLLAEHPEDPRAALAAMTLGRIEQDVLRTPAAAAAHFVHARSLGVPRALALDLESRLALAWLDARDARGVEAARQYVTEHPDGPRVGDIRNRLAEREMERR